jgi:hypothetical protein
MSVKHRFGAWGVSVCAAATSAQKPIGSRIPPLSGSHFGNA